jgi:hypothetical protein
VRFTQAERMAGRSLFMVFRSWHALVIGVGFAVSACSPGAFDELANQADDAGPEEPGRSKAARRGGSEDDDAAAEGGSSAARASGTGGAGAAGTGGRAGAPAAGSGGAAAAGGGAAAETGGSGGAAGGAPADPGPAPCTHASDLAQVSLSTSEVGELATPSWVASRTLAATAVVRDRVLLVFSVPTSEGGMTGWGTAEGLLSSPPRLEEQGPFVPLFDTSAVPARTDVSIGSAVPDGNSALLYFASAEGFQVEDAGIARISRDGNRAEVLQAAGALFPRPSAADPGPWRPAFVNGGVVVTEGDVDYVYVYGCQPNPNNPDEAENGVHESPCRLARVPRNQAATASSYRYWTGSEWSADVSLAAIVIDHASIATVSYNTYLAKYLATSATGLNSVSLRWADRPEGPWKALAEFKTIVATGGFGTTFSAVEVPALRDACQRVTYVSYATSESAPTAADPMAVKLSTRFVRVELH